MTAPRVLSFGAGVNSTALLVGLVERGEPPDLVLFADTEAERPETYAHVERVDEWLRERSLAPMVRVRSNRSLESLCLERNMLPSLAYGRRACSMKHKHQPQDRFLRTWEPARSAWAAGERVVKLLGIGWDEADRMHFDPRSRRWVYEYPLVAWRWDRAACAEAIRSAGLVVPPKSACFFCPASRKGEVLALRREHPDLFERALAIERGAILRTVKGLGRRFSWAAVAAADERQLRLFDEAPALPCVCFDGDPAYDNPAGEAGSKEPTT